MIPVYGASSDYERFIRGIILSLPSWYVVPARLSKIVVIKDPNLAKQVGAYSHGSRDLKLSPGVGTILERVISHELAHGFDDSKPSGSAHRFSRSDDWMFIHRNAQHFELPKYRDEPQEYFADMCSKYILHVAGSRTGNSLQRSHPRESQYILDTVVPVLMRETARKE